MELIAAIGNVGKGAGLWWRKDGTVSDFVVRWDIFIANERNPAN